MAATESRDFDEELAATPKSESRRRWRARSRERDRDKEREPSDRLGRAMEAVARGMGTSMFLIILTIFVTIWMTWNSVAPEAWRFDSADIGFTALTLMLSLQASYAAPMLLLAQNRQDDRDRVQIEQDRQRAERNTADLEYLAREIVALRILVKDMATKDFIRAELRALLEDIEELDEDDDDEERAAASGTDAARAILERREASRRRMRDRD
ncbi:DUF1003 domain-containing protein [Pseudoclavibacter alba]|uniref:DUF1003 domain-containing protein n=1 Tax=Pseudoclavibacter albus TaxID=272241 RepID=A0ABT2HY26_9MICO|nr:DUF1003 domain-containing protein [Pseudoclavibacter alba]MBN6777640.1 DUF1003 domain-containing protein [Pseudoclavibacter alba]MCT2043214.1 DUF1003 domain-containing protein [Pseudoclavibacter alba]